MTTTTQTKRFVGKDPNGIPRVFGEDANIDVAETFCRDEASRYITRRPDTGPLTRWTFEVAQ